MTRPLNRHEASFIEGVAKRLAGNLRDSLLRDLASAFVQEETADGSRITFGINGYERPPYEGQQSYGIEGKLTDKDGASVSVDLFSDQNGRLLELELVRWGHGNLQEPDWTSLSHVFPA
jgi:hypothetical protein